MAFAGLCGLLNSHGAANYGIYETYAVLSANGGANTFYDAGAITGNTDFHGANLGTFDPSINSLVLKGGEVKTFKNGVGDVTGAFLAYRIWMAGNESGSFVELTLPFGLDLGGGNQSWQTTAATINVLNGLGSGNYTLEVYFRAAGNQGDVFDNRSGPNYEATFSVVPEPTTVALSAFGVLLLVGGVWRRFRQPRSASPRG